MINPVSYTHLDVYKRQEIYNPEEETYRLQREYADYIVKQSGSSYKLDRLENWEILSKQYI